jgi:hypothetical protein
MRTKREPVAKKSPASSPPVRVLCGRWYEHGEVFEDPDKPSDNPYFKVPDLAEPQRQFGMAVFGILVHETENHYFVAAVCGDDGEFSTPLAIAKGAGTFSIDEF